MYSRSGAVAVALLAEGVDRNSFKAMVEADRRVALLAEGVDRNHLSTLAVVELMRVALLAEGVDRNLG